MAARYPGRFPMRRLEPFYAEAEAMLEVSGTADPLTPQMRYDLSDPSGT